MNKKLIGKLLIVILLISIVITNVSYAVNIDKELFKKSLRHLYASDIKLQQKVLAKDLVVHQLLHIMHHQN